MMKKHQERPQAAPPAVIDREKREAALDRALEQSFPASDTPSMLRAHPRVDAGGEPTPR